jgi:hypothetical protein
MASDMIAMEFVRIPPATSIKAKKKFKKKAKAMFLLAKSAWLWSCPIVVLFEIYNHFRLVLF